VGEEKKIVKGRVIQSTGSWYKVNPGTDEPLECRLPGRFRLGESELTNPLAVGDYVEVSVNEDGTGTIEEIEDRDNAIIRKATHGRQGGQVLAANVDRAIVVQSIRKPKLKEGFIDRFLVTCEAYHVAPLIVINKMDLAKDRDRRFIDDLQELYKGLGYDFLTTSIHYEDSLETLKAYLKDRTSVFVGPSGVGKTSLLNALDPELELPVKEVSSYSQKGRHTTTFARLLPLHFGGWLVDTPGIREFGLMDIEPTELSLYFPEMIEPRQHCKFYNCTHSHEPKCGVMAAYEAGEIDPSRYQSYLQMLESLEENRR